jgi:hypothetical protein
VAHVDIFVVPGTETALEVKSLLPVSSEPRDAIRKLPLLARVSGYEIDEDSNRSGELAGESFVQAVKVPFKNGFSLIFPFVVCPLRMCTPHLDD